MKFLNCRILAAALAFAAVAPSASAQLIDLRFDGSSWVATTKSSNPYTIIGSNFAANSVFVGNGTVIQRLDNLNATPTVGNTYTGISPFPLQLATSNPGNYQFANLGTSMIRLGVMANGT